MAENNEVLAQELTVHQPSHFVNSFGIDWLRFSVPVTEFPTICALLDISLDDSRWMEARKYNYDFFTMPIEGVIVATKSLPGGKDTIAGSRFIVDFSGNGLAHFFDRNKWATPSDLLHLIGSLEDVNINRLDIALDCFQRRYLSVSKFNTCFNEKRIRARWARKTYRLIKNPIADSAYWGNRTGNSMVRVYDKREQMIGLGVKEADLPNYWVRLELELKNKTAVAVVKTLAEHGVTSKSLGGIIRGFIDFLDGKDSNKYRAKSVNWWLRLIRHAETVPIRLPQKVYGLAKVKKWLMRQVAPSLAMMIEAYEGDMTWLYELIHDGRSRLRPDQIAMIETFMHGG